MTTMQEMSLGQMAAILQVSLGASWIQLVEEAVRDAADETVGVKWDETGWGWIGVDENGMTKESHFAVHAEHTVHAVRVAHAAVVIAIVIAIVRAGWPPCFCFARYGGVDTMARALMHPLCRRTRVDSGARCGRSDFPGLPG